MSWSPDFEWDLNNLPHCERHGVTPEVVGQVAANDPRLFPDDEENHAGSDFMTGPDDAGRFWTVVLLAKFNDLWWPSLAGLVPTLKSAATGRAMMSNKYSEEELRDYYQSRKGDVSTWAKQPRKLRRKPGDGPTTSFAVRLTPAELRELQDAAEKRDVNVSEFIRSASLAEARLNASSERVELLRMYIAAYDAVKATEAKSEPKPAASQTSSA